MSAMIATLALALAVFLQGPPPSQAEVDKALQKASDWLIMKINEGLPGDVSVNSGMGLSYNPLVLYALHHAGVDPKNPTFQRVLDGVARAKIAKTYMAACTAMALQAVNADKYRKKIWECGQYLADNMCDNGQWSYGVEYEIPKPEWGDDSGSTRATVIIKRQKPVGGKAGDNSNSQYAALGLRACGMAGFEFENSFLDKTIAWWEQSQFGDGSWNYGENGVAKEKDGGFGSMTAGGGASVIILRKLKGQRVKSSAAGKAISWLGANFSASEHPKSPSDRTRFHHYYLYSLERLGDLYPADKMGKHLWYAEGARWLLDQQKENGPWVGEWPGLDIADTCFAILFLKRATRVATGETKKPDVDK